jgi:hypothetical protein
MIRFSLLFTFILSLDTPLAPLERGIKSPNENFFTGPSSPLERGRGCVFIFLQIPLLNQNPKNPLVTL